MNANSAVIGSWKLLSFELRTKSQEVTYPMGQDALGIITYTPEGRMFVAIMRAQREHFVTEDFTNGTLAEKAAAMDSYTSYTGPYTVEENRVIHHIDLGWFPNWVGTDQERFFKIEGKQLTIWTPPFIVEGREQTAILVWERVKA